MFTPTTPQLIFILTAFVIEIILVLHFAVRKVRFSLALRLGPFVYTLGLPAAAVSIFLLFKGEPWYFWLGGFLCLAWAAFGYLVEYVFKIEWRLSLRWPIFIPYICLYLATLMFYWFPLKLIYSPLWYAYLVLFALSTFLNISSHKPSRSVV